MPYTVSQKHLRAYCAPPWPRRPWPAIISLVPRLPMVLAFALGTVTACDDTNSGSDSEDELAPLDVRALLWCVPSSGEGATADGTRVSVVNTASDPGACLCLPVGTMPTTGSELDATLHDLAREKCEQELEALGAVTTRCEELISDAPVDYEEPCEPDEWPSPP